MYEFWLKIAKKTKKSNIKFEFERYQIWIIIIIIIEIEVEDDHGYGYLREWIHSLELFFSLYHHANPISIWTSEIRNQKIRNYKIESLRIYSTICRV